MPPATPSNSEWFTRKLLIDGRLRTSVAGLFQSTPVKSVAVGDSGAVKATNRDFPALTGDIAAGLRAPG
jgi:hypothetical protein